MPTSEPNLGELRAELTAAGVFKTRELRGWLELVGLAVALAACFAAIAVFGARTAFVAIPIAGVVATTMAMFGHEGSHRSFSRSPRRNSLIVHFSFPLFAGLSAGYWRDKHDRRHHAHPNVEGLDRDLEPFPFSSSRAAHEASGPKTRWFQRRFQRWLFWPMATLMAIGMRRSSIMFLSRQRRDRGWWLEVGCMTAHYLSWLLVPSLVFGFVPALLVYLTTWAISGVCLALIFAPAHMGMPVLAKPNHEWRHQIDTTRDLQLPRVISFFFVGLDYQVEHHLFPKISHQHLPLAAKITRDWCHRRGIEHHSEPYLFALADSVRFMASAWSREAVETVGAPAMVVAAAAEPIVLAPASPERAIVDVQPA